MIVQLLRDTEQKVSYCTLGTIELEGRTICQTMEKPWIPHAGALCGEQQQSCIGKGVYRLERRDTEARGMHWILSNAALGVYRSPADIPPNIYARSLILIHAANWAHELLGCIAPGLARAVMEGEQAVTSSRQAMADLHNLLDTTNDLHLEIQ